MNAGVFAYAWDLEAEGYDRAVGELAANGITHINLATAYHAGKFLLPRNPRHRTYFPQDGSLYFRPELSRYGRIRPRVNALVTHTTDPVARLTAATRRHGLRYVAWVVLMHNSWLGARYPDATMHTAFGDPVLHSLSPAHPDVRAYVLAMVGDLVSRYDVTALALESPGYMTYTHGWHHEFGGVALDPAQERLMGTSFSPYEIAAASAAGIDAHGARASVASLLDRSWNDGFRLADGETLHPEVEALFADAEFVAYQHWLDDRAVSLSAEIRDAVKAASPGTDIYHVAALDGREPDPALLATGDGILTGYATSDDDARRRVERVKPLGKTIVGMVRALPPDTTAPGQIARRVAAWRSAGVDAVDTYNYGFLPRWALRELFDAIR